MAVVVMVVTVVMMVLVAVMVMIDGGLCGDYHCGRNAGRCGSHNAAHSGGHNAGHCGDRISSLSGSRHNVFRCGYFDGCCSSCQKQRWPADGFF